MRIAIDAMGGDRAPAAPVAGAVRALDAYPDVELVLVGDPARIAAELDGIEGSGAVRARIATHDAPEIAGKDGDPVRAIRASSRNSARASAELLHAGEVQGVLTMGPTGAAVAAATLYCRRLEGVRRTGIAVPMPRPNGASVLIDCGANPDARPADLHQYALMAAIYVRAALEVEAPRIGILSIGEEEKKGNRLVAETWEAFRQRPLPNFVGNVEPRELFEDRADVVVCDGFTGNVVLKTAEGMAEFAMRRLGEVLGPRDEGLTKEALGHLAQKIDYSHYGGALLLGVEGAYVIGHGRSGPHAFLNGVRVIRSYIQSRVGEHIVEQLAREGAAS